jgi:hypothetical protein
MPKFEEKAENRGDEMYQGGARRPRETLSGQFGDALLPSYVIKSLAA